MIILVIISKSSVIFEHYGRHSLQRPHQDRMTEQPFSKNNMTRRNCWCLHFYGWMQVSHVQQKVREERKESRGSTKLIKDNSDSALTPHKPYHLGIGDWPSLFTQNSLHHREKQSTPQSHSGSNHKWLSNYWHMLPALFTNGFPLVFHGFVLIE